MSVSEAIFYIWFPFSKVVVRNLTTALKVFLKNRRRETTLVEWFQLPKEEVWIGIADLEKYILYSDNVQKVTTTSLRHESMNVKWEAKLGDATIEWEDEIKMKNSKYQALFHATRGDFDLYERKIRLATDEGKTKVIQNVKMKFSLGPLDDKIAEIIQQKVWDLNTSLLRGMKAKIESQ